MQDEISDRCAARLIDAAPDRRHDFGMVNMPAIIKLPDGRVAPVYSDGRIVYIERDGRVAETKRPAEASRAPSGRSS